HRRVEAEAGRRRTGLDIAPADVAAEWHAIERLVPANLDPTAGVGLVHAAIRTQRRLRTELEGTAPGRAAGRGRLGRGPDRVERGRIEDVEQRVGLADARHQPGGRRAR